MTHSQPVRQWKASPSPAEVGPTTTVLIVDDYEPFRALARRLLEAAEYDVVGEAADGESAIEAGLSLRPAVVLLDVNLPDVDGFAVARRLTAAASGPVVVLTSSSAESAFGGLVAASGARGFLPKDRFSAAALARLL